MEQREFDAFFEEVYSFFFKGKIPYCNPSFIDLEKLRVEIRDITDAWVEGIKTYNRDDLIELDMSMSQDLAKLVCPAIPKLLTDSRYNINLDKLQKIITKYFRIEIDDD